MYWYRLMKSFSRNSIVGTTIKSTDKLPKDLLADEKHTKINGEKAYVATIAGDDCILGASISEKADIEGLKMAYAIRSQFKIILIALYPHLLGFGSSLTFDERYQTLTCDQWGHEAK